MYRENTQLPLFGEQETPTSDNPVECLVIRVLNLYAGIGGNRKKWENVDVTAVEYDSKIAEIYQDHFPGDTIIVGDAHEYLLNHYKEFDFIWSSPPCPTHSKMRMCCVKSGQSKAVYPDMKLWQEIYLLKHFAKCKWVIENVNPYYQPFLQPAFCIDRHFFWSNFHVPQEQFVKKDTGLEDLKKDSEVFGFKLDNYNMSTKETVKMLRNMVNPDVGAHILDYV